MRFKMDMDYSNKLITKANKVMGKEVGAKLTTKQRKKLKDSTFCGPGRSFPVNDCAHYTAALRLLNRSKFSKSTKDKIRSCVNSKGKKMGCGGSKKAKARAVELGIDIEALINSDVFATTRDLVEESIGNPGKCLHPDGNCDVEGGCDCQEDGPCRCDKPCACE
jgi:hypothetical protein